jgi:hypothetical protein
MDIGQQLCGEGENPECEKRDKRDPFIGEEGEAPRGVRQPIGEILLLFISLFMVVTPLINMRQPPI